MSNENPNYPTFGSKRGFRDMEEDSDVEMQDRQKNSPPPNQAMDIDDINDDKFSGDEAVEDRGYGDEEEEKKNDSEESGEDLLDNMEQDYKAVPELDQYE